MPKYNIPLLINTTIEVEAENLEQAVDAVHKLGNKEVSKKINIDLSKVENWEVDQWAPIQKGDETIGNEDGDLYLGDCFDQTKY